MTKMIIKRQYIEVLRWKSWLTVFSLLLAALIATGCINNSDDVSSTDTVVQGPAFVLFFTDP